jgi:sulfite reductase (NADPH) flavoprotein alpha-component
MAFGPRLPDSAPFTAAQRAWLDGYVAGWFSFESDTVGESSPRTSLTAATAEAEAFPWHDPTLPLEERLALAEGRRPSGC